MNKLSSRASRIVYGFCQDEARKANSPEILPEHILLSLLKTKDCLGFMLLSALKIDLEEYETCLKNQILKEDPVILPELEEIPQNWRVKNFLELADLESLSLKNQYTGTEHLVLAAAREKSSVSNAFFLQKGISLPKMRLAVLDVQKEHKSSNLKKLSQEIAASTLEDILGITSLFDAEDFVTIEDVDETSGELNNTEQQKEEKTNTEKQKNHKKEQKHTFLSEYTRDITYLAKIGKIDPVVGRESEIKRIIQVLSRRTKNNPVLVGDPGVGKTAIVEGLAHYIAQGKVPSSLMNKKVLSLDIAQMVAGTKYRGEFEERMKKMMKEVREDTNIILFIDELHTIIGAGGPEGQMDASNMIKPALSRGELQIIGATTTKEYTKYIEKDSALERRFQKIAVEEPNDSDTEKILEGIKKQYETFHSVVYEDDVIPLIVKLSRRYIQERSLPDKAIDILDEAGAQKKIEEDERPLQLIELEKKIDLLTEEKKNLVELQDYENAARVRDKVIELKHTLEEFSSKWKESSASVIRKVSCHDVCRIIGEMTGIPVSQLDSSEAKRLVNMEQEMHKTVIGQEQAVKVISGAIRRSRAGISSPNRPIGSFIFLGPTGVGKTQLAKALAKFLFGSEEQLIRIDMSDFMEKHNASRLVGAPPGYVGYEDGGILTEQVRRHPYSVVLLDEIEKAHTDVFNLLLQMLEEGELSDNLGHTVNFRNTVVIMTSNAGARQITSESHLGFSSFAEGVLPYEEIKTNAMNELKKLLNPELLNRIDDVIVFEALNQEEIAEILNIQISLLSERLSEKGMSINVTKEAAQYLSKNGYEPSMGARPMRRLIQKEIEDPLSVALLDRLDESLSQVVVDFADGKIEVRLEGEPEVVTQNVQIVRQALT